MAPLYCPIEQSIQQGGLQASKRMGEALALLFVPRTINFINFSVNFVTSPGAQ